MKSMNNKIVKLTFTWMLRFGVAGFVVNELIDFKWIDGPTWLPTLLAVLTGLSALIMIGGMVSGTLEVLAFCCFAGGGLLSVVCDPSLGPLRGMERFRWFPLWCTVTSIVGVCALMGLWFISGKSDKTSESGDGQHCIGRT